jgi:hypothetical protein
MVLLPYSPELLQNALDHVVRYRRRLHKPGNQLVLPLVQRRPFLASVPCFRLQGANSPCPKLQPPAPVKQHRAQCEDFLFGIANALQNSSLIDETPALG